MMQPQFETIEEFTATSEISDTTVKVRLRRQVNHEPTRFIRGPYWLDLHAGRVHVPHYGVDENFAREAAARFLLQYVQGIAPRLH